MLSTLYDDALAYTAALHREQVRKGTDIPYISHLLAVSALVIESGGTEDEAIAALLHDAAEDQGGRKVLAEIAQRYGAEVARIVAGCTDAWITPKPPWRERKEKYLAHLQDADSSVLRVSCADKVHNARAVANDLAAVGTALWDRFRGKREGTLWYYRSLANTFSALDVPTRLRDALEREVGRIEALDAAQDGQSG